MNCKLNFNNLENRKRKIIPESTNFLSLMQEAEQNKNIDPNHNYDITFKRTAEKTLKINDKFDSQREQSNFTKKKFFFNNFN